ncbi:CBS domain-containing protein [Marinomonas ostreistagni]|uniref:CBS domain-containing protein n=1 Tax=Marinomonas ostreistagni TaxID=359209 RepID=UPI00195241FE|nr:CBS domain-containing protein [Marinomonas ostreistagni]MBM6551002.1 CBS domain-containing protein [Marinomonas ostreistagni]
MKLDALCVRDIMSHDTFHVQPTTAADECARQLALHKLSGAPVTDQYGRLIGFVSEQDLLGPLSQSAYHCDSPGSVAKVMSEDVLFVTPDQQVMQVVNLMMGSKPKIYPVVEEGRLIGIVTRRLVMRALLQAQQTCTPV